jgi:hypothetical protein
MTCQTSDDEIVRRYEYGLDDAAPTEPYWSSIRNRAQELFDDPVTPGVDYALTEVVRCPSINERKGDVLTAARFCHPKWLMATLEEARGARFVIGVGDHAMRTLPKVLPVQPDGRVQKVQIVGRTVLVSFLPGPGSSHQKMFETTHSPEERRRLRGALSSR